VAAPDEPAPRDRDYPWMSLETWKQRHQAILDLSAERKKQAEVVIVGDSIVEGWDNVVWEEFYAPQHALRMGIGGDRTQQVLWRIDHGELDGLKPRVLVLLIGTNNIGADGATPETIAKGIGKIVDKVKRKLPETKVLLVGVLPREERADAPIRREVRAINALIADLDDGARVRFVDIGAKFLEPGGSVSREVLRDFLHPTAKGYRIFAEAIAPTLAVMSNKSSGHP
jgi:beta-glucosidase